MMKKRIVSLDFLRIAAMFMVVLLHVQGKTGWLTFYEINQGNWYLRWSIQSFAISAVNIYVLISGFLLADAKFSLSKVLTLILRALFWSMLIFLIYCLMGGAIDPFVVLGAVFPFSYESYWFLTVYVGMYAIAPVFIYFFKNAGKTKHLLFTIVLLVLCSVLPTILPLSSGISGILP